MAWWIACRIRTATIRSSGCVGMTEIIQCIRKTNYARPQSMGHAFIKKWRKEITMTDTSLIPEKEVMNKLGVSSRQTIWNYTNRHGFPKPVRTHPKAYLREAVDGWILNGGVNQKCS